MQTPDEPVKAEERRRTTASVASSKLPTEPARQRCCTLKVEFGTAHPIVSNGGNASLLLILLNTEGLGKITENLGLSTCKSSVIVILFTVLLSGQDRQKLLE